MIFSNIINIVVIDIVISIVSRINVDKFSVSVIREEIF